MVGACLCLLCCLFRDTWQVKSKYPWALIASVFIALGYIKYKDLKAGYDADAARFEEQDKNLRAMAKQWSEQSDKKNKVAKP